MLLRPFCECTQIEYMVVSFDEAGKNARLSLRQSEILTELAAEEAEAITAMPGAASVAFLQHSPHAKLTASPYQPSNTKIPP